MLKRFIDNCIKNKIFTSNEKIIIAVSGGADSLALADLLFRARQRFNLTLCIAHFEHGLRGEDSLADADFVRKFAEDLNLEFLIESGNVKEFAQSNKLSIETAARELRYQFLEKVLKNLKFDKIALAHHADDQAETILMRILRGAGSVGISSMKFKSAKLVRPLLTFKKSELEQYCQSRNLIPRIDLTNFETNALRNKIRLELLPKLQEYNPSIVDTLCRLGISAADDSDFIMSQAQKVFPSAVKMADSKLKLSKSIIKEQHIALQRAIIRLFIERAVGSLKDFEFVHIESIRRVIVDDLKGVELPNKLRIDSRRGWLEINNKD